MTKNNRIHIIWNISPLCPWDCTFCCTDSFSLPIKGSGSYLKKGENIYNILEPDKLAQKFESMYSKKPSRYDIGLFFLQEE